MEQQALLRQMNEFPEHLWEDLLDYIEEGTVIPVVGQDLLTIKTPAESFLFSEIARRIARELGVPDSFKNGEYDYLDLDRVISSYPPFLKNRASIYSCVKRALDGFAVDIPEPLTKLARIQPFKLFVTTTPDELLAKAINNERYAGRSVARCVAYYPNSTQDLSPTFHTADPVTVFQLLGRAAASRMFAVTEEDVLEFIHSIHSSDHCPRRLFDELRTSHLLLLGNSFPDWLSRFFLRLVRNSRLWQPGTRLEILVDRHVHRDDHLSTFLERHSPGTIVYKGGTASTFVNELYDRWVKRKGTQEADAQTASAGQPSIRMEDEAIFISYAREDSLVVEQLAGAIKDKGLDIWFDAESLEGGEEFERAIHRNIRRCSVFIAVVSLNTERRDEGFFRKEWHWAVQRAADFTGSSRCFLIPVLIDQLKLSEARVPEEFLRCHAINAPGGSLPDKFLTDLVSAVRELRKRRALSPQMSHTMRGTDESIN